MYKMNPLTRPMVLQKNLHLLYMEKYGTHAFVGKFHLTQIGVCVIFYSIHVIFQGLEFVSSFHISSYSVLPKFQVKIKPPSYIALGQSTVFGDICAK